MIASESGLETKIGNTETNNNVRNTDPMNVTLLGTIKFNRPAELKAHSLITTTDLKI